MMKGVVHIVRGVQLDDRVVRHEVVQPLGPEEEPGHDLARVQGLALVGDHPTLYQVDHRQDPIPEQVWDFRQEDGSEVGTAFVNRLAHVLANEQGIMAEALGVLRLGVRRLCEVEQVDDLDIPQLRRPLHQRRHQPLRYPGLPSQVDPLPRGNDPDGLLSARTLSAVDFLKAHRDTSSAMPRAAASWGLDSRPQ